MKIIFSNYDDLKNPFYGGGGAVAIHEVAKRLAINNEVNVVTGNYINANNAILNGVNYLRVGCRVFGPKIGQLLFSLAILKKTITEKYDVWIDSFTPPFSVSLIPLLSKKPVIGLVHMLSGNDMKRKYGLPFDSVERFGLRFYKNIISVSDQNAKLIKKIQPNCNLVVIPNGVTVPKTIITNKKKQILFLGRIEVNQKGLDLLIEAFSLLRTEVKLVIAGGGIKSELIKLNKLIEKYKLKEKVLVTGKVSGKEKETLLRESMFLVLSSRFETFPITALEALSYSLPIICFDIDGTKWISSTCSIKVKNQDAPSLSEAVLELIQNNIQLKKMRVGAKKFARMYNWDKIVKLYQDYIKKIVFTETSISVEHE